MLHLTQVRKGHGVTLFWIFSKDYPGVYVTWSRLFWIKVEKNYTKCQLLFLRVTVFMFFSNPQKVNFSFLLKIILTSLSEYFTNKESFLHWPFFSQFHFSASMKNYSVSLYVYSVYCVPVLAKLSLETLASVGIIKYAHFQGGFACYHRLSCSTNIAVMSFRCCCSRDDWSIFILELVLLLFHYTKDEKPYRFCAVTDTSNHREIRISKLFTESEENKTLMLT